MAKNSTRPQRLNIQSVIKWKNSKGNPYNNSVCVVVVKNERLLFKIPRYASLKSNWEYVASKRINKYLKGMIGFSKVRASKILYWDQDKYGMPIPSTNKPVYPVLTSIQTYIESDITMNSFVSHPRTRIDDVLCLLIQILISVHFAQKSCQFTHYDLHSSNVMIRDLSEKKSWNLYNISLPDGTKETYLIPSLGFRPIIIDYEFSHTKELFDENLKEEDGLGRIDLVDHGYIPSKYDPLCDSVRIFMSVVRHYLDVHKDMKEKSRYMMLKNFYDYVFQSYSNLHPGRDIDIYGLKCKISDHVKSNFLDIARTKNTKKDKVFRNWIEFCDKRYSVIVDLLSQAKKYFKNSTDLPTYGHDNRGRIEKIVDIFELLFEASKNNWDRAYKILEEKFRTLQDKDTISHDDSSFYYIITSSEAIVELYEEFIEREHITVQNYSNYAIKSLGPLALAKNCYEMLSPDVKRLYPTNTPILFTTENETRLKYATLTPKFCEQMQKIEDIKERGELFEREINL